MTECILKLFVAKSCWTLINLMLTNRHMMLEAIRWWSNEERGQERERLRTIKERESKRCGLRERMRETE